MAALDFPASPTNGQLYPAAPNAQYIYNATAGGPSVGAWESLPMESAKTVTADVPPANPVDGDQWFSTVDGVLYIYVVDVDGGQWVESRSAIISDGYYSPNVIINGAFDIWQRGNSFNSFAATNVYTADRFYGYRQALVAGMTISRQAAGLSGFQYCARVQRDSGNTSVQETNLLCDLESVSSIPLAGKTVTMSFYARAGANYSSAGNVMNFIFATGTGTDQAIRSGYTGQVSPTISYTLTTSWQRFTYTTTIPSNVTQIGFVFRNLPVGTAGAADYFEITGVQLEEGSTATPFRRAGGTIQGELAACQRYYYRTDNQSSSPYNSFAMGLGETTNRASFAFVHPVTMRVKPHTLEHANTAIFDGVNVITSPSAVTLWSNNTNRNQSWFWFDKTSSITISKTYFFLADGNTSGYVAVSAEL